MQTCSHDGPIGGDYGQPRAGTAGRGRAGGGGIAEARSGGGRLRGGRGRTGPDAVWQAREFDYDAELVDLMLPAIDGVQVCRELRSAGRRPPVLMLTVRDAIEDRVRGLDAGADDYLAKPFSFR